jgi:type VI secretion system secreted protein Hcp
MAVDYFLKLDGIEGESEDDKHKNEIQLTSFSWGETQQGTMAFGGGGGAGKVQFQDGHFTAHTNKASPKLAIACATGQHIKTVVLSVRKAGGSQEDYYKVILTDVLVSSFQSGGSSGADAVPVDQFSLNFAAIEFEYKPQKDDGSLGSSQKIKYNLKLLKAG